MKKSIFLLVFLLGFVLVGCNKPKEDPKIILSSTSISLEVGDTYDIKPDTKALLGAKVLYSSSDETVVTVSSSGKVTALKEGSASIEVSLENYKDQKEQIAVTVTKATDVDPDPEEQLTVSGPTEVKVGETIQLVAVDTLDVDGYGVLWVAKNNDIAKVNQQGVVTGVKAGVATFEIHSKENSEHISFEITVLEVFPEEINITANIAGERIKTTANLKLTAKILPAAANQGIIWTSDDDSIAVVNEDGIVTISNYGFVTFTATSIEDSEVFESYTVEIYWDVMDLVDYLMEPQPVVQHNVRAYGYEIEYETTVFGSVINYYINDYPYFERWTPSGLGNMPEVLMESVEFVTVHDTGSASAGADAKMHANYMYQGTGGREASWHFSVGDDGVWQQIDTDYASWHAGDGSRRYKLYDTGVLATSKIKPAQGISVDGYYTLDGVKTNIVAPLNTFDNRIALTSEINDYGIYMEIGENGNWWINESYFSLGGYNKISNAGGNYNSVSMETMINQGSDLYRTWQHSAKLVAEILIKYDLGLDRVMFHHNFSGKDCPQTLRKNGLIPNFLKMIEAEYLAQKFLSGYSFTIVSGNPDLVDSKGKIIGLPNQESQISVLVTVSNDSGFEQSKVYYSTLPAK